MRRTRQCCIFRSRKAIKEYSGNRSGISLRHMRPWLFLAPSLGGTAIFVLIPFVNVVVRSFFQAVGGQFVGMENFIQVFHSQAFRLAVKNTLHFVLVCIPALMAFSLWTAILVTGAADSRSLYKTTIMLPMAIPVASVVLLWKLLLYPQGLLDQLAVWAGGRGQDWLNQGSAFYILVLTYIWKNTGYDMMLWPGWTEYQKSFLRRQRWTAPVPGRAFFMWLCRGLGVRPFWCWCCLLSIPLRCSERHT